ncbi:MULTISPECIES: ribosome maturation factor RimP [Clostridium]|uniref:Ribosome maturation factor RimP n=1 Tax=Clostridium senegalense TaxID=1465809 RepID=A0A6M0GYB1_9CLOT|nr:MULTISPECIES: ribosome maturation factor RimP [Clostridium]NEU03339.1 ribosome maturation factor RimP [Clostridium senegalense]
MENSILVEKLNGLAQPIVEKSGCEMYHLEYVKEAGEYIFRVYIDSEKGISLSECEKVSRELSDVLDIEDPITDEYTLEVQSPGIFRTLFTDKHIEKYIGYDVKVNLKKLLNGKKKYEGVLKKFDTLNLVIEISGEEIVIPREKVSQVTLNPSL